MYTLLSHGMASGLAVFCLMVWSIPCHGESRRLRPGSIGEWVEKADVLYGKGNFRGAGDLFEASIASLNKSMDMDVYVRVVVRLAECYKALGYHKRALPLFKKALPLLRLSQDRCLNALFLRALADVHFSLGNTEESARWLTAALKEARLGKNPAALAAALNDMGNGLVWNKNFKGGLAAYDEALNLMESEGGDAFLNARIKTLINKTRLLHMSGETGDALTIMEIIATEMKRLLDDHQKASNLVAFHAVIDDVAKNARRADQRETLFLMSETALKQGLEIAEKWGDDKQVSLINGNLGQLYETRPGHEKKAAMFTRRAIFFAGQSAAPELLYLWQWQMGRLFAAEKNVEKAIDFYQRAIQTLNPIRSDLFVGYRLRKDFFNERIKPVYLGLAALFLEQAERISDKKKSQDKLHGARDAMEILKTAELEDYFQSECAVAAGKKNGNRDPIPKGAVLIYPIILKNSLILLAAFSDGMKQKTIDVSAKELKQAVTNFRIGLQNRTDRRFMHNAKKIYDWLIRPFEGELDAYHIDTLAIAPDGALRLIPFSTLYDGEKFLVERYAISVVPAISLIDFSPFQWSENSKILITGLSEAVQGFSALPGVSAELRDIRRIMSAKTFYSDKQHNLENLKNEFRDNAYSIIHMATHGVFGDSPENTFLLLYDDKLNMSGLSDLINIGKFRETPVELLTLSACQTALGDERAALGLAGVAVKAGVKSVVATLWFVDDEATSIGIREFYRQLKIPGMSRAKALQNAQKRLISTKRYWHPAYWAPFLLIGNWM